MLIATCVALEGFAVHLERSMSLYQITALTGTHCFITGKTTILDAYAMSAYLLAIYSYMCEWNWVQTGSNPISSTCVKLATGGTALHGWFKGS